MRKMCNWTFSVTHSPDFYTCARIEIKTIILSFCLTGAGDKSKQIITETREEKVYLLLWSCSN